MDDEQRKYFATLLSSMEGVASDARSAASTSRETAQAVRRLDQRVAVVEGHVTVLHTHVFGRPPTSSPPPPVTRPLAESVGDHESEIATLAGQILTVNAKVDSLDVKQDEQIVMLGKIVKALGNPWVKRVAYALGAIIVGYATSKGFLR